MQRQHTETHPHSGAGGGGRRKERERLTNAHFDSWKKVLRLWVLISELFPAPFARAEIPMQVEKMGKHRLLNTLT